jgi:hypothetical protein
VLAAGPTWQRGRAPMNARARARLLSMGLPCHRPESSRAETKTPVLIVGAERNTMLSVTEIEATASACNTRAHIVPDVAHNSQLLGPRNHHHENNAVPSRWRLWALPNSFVRPLRLSGRRRRAATSAAHGPPSGDRVGGQAIEHSSNWLCEFRHGAHDACRAYPASHLQTTPRGVVVVPRAVDP